MALQTLNTIKQWFKTGLKPTQAQFWDTWDSFRHKFDKIPVKEVEGLDELLLSKADKTVLDHHLADKNAHAPQVNTDWNSESGFSQLLNKPEFKTINGEAIVGTGDLVISGTTLWKAGTVSTSITTVDGDNDASGVKSIALGHQTTASGYASYAEGSFTQSSGNNSHAEGNETIATSSASHSEGYQTSAQGPYSHAEGQATKAIGTGSHSEGYKTSAQGLYSHAEGKQTIALGDYSHAGGNESEANAIYSFVHGNNSFANNENTIVLGANITGTESDTTYVDKLNIKTIPVGTLDKSLGVDADGNVIAGSSESGGSQTLDQVLGTGNKTSGKNIIINADANSNGSLVINSNNRNTTTTVNDGAVILTSNISSENAGISYGGIYMGGNNNRSAAYLPLGAFISNSEEIYSLNLNKGLQYTKKADQDEDRTSTNIVFDSTNKGEFTQTFQSKSGKIALLSDIPTGGSVWESGIGEGSVQTTGKGNNARGKFSVAEGTFTESVGEASHTEGSGTKTYGMYSHAEGGYTRAEGSHSHAEGVACQAIGDYSHAQGFQTVAYGEKSHAQGGNTRAEGNSSHAEGNQSAAYGYASHAEGSGTEARGARSHAGGALSKANGDISFVHGLGSEANGESTIVLGNGIKGTKDDTVYIKELNITNVPSGVPVNNLGIDADGYVIIGSSGGGGSQDLQSVLDNGSLWVKPDGLGTFAVGSNSFPGVIALFSSTEDEKCTIVQLSPTNGIGLSSANPSTDTNVSLNIRPIIGKQVGFLTPDNKESGNYILATTGDLTLQNVLDTGNEATINGGYARILGNDKGNPSSAIEYPSDGDLYLTKFYLNPSEANIIVQTENGKSGMIALPDSFKMFLNNQQLRFEEVQPNSDFKIIKIPFVYEDSTLATTDDIKLKSYTVSDLPTGTIGDQAYVTDATAPTYLGALAGGGSVVCPVFYNGTTWVSH